MFKNVIFAIKITKCKLFYRFLLQKMYKLLNFAKILAILLYCCYYKTVLTVLFQLIQLDWVK